MNTAGMSLGYLNYLDKSRKNDQSDLQTAILREKVEEAQRVKGARGIAGTVLKSAFDDDDDSQLPPAPGQPSVPMQQASQQGGAAPAQPPQAAPGPGPGGPVNYRPYEAHVAAAQPQGEEMPAAPAAAEKPDASTRPRKQMQIGSIVQSLKKNNVPDWQVMDVLDQLSPLMTQANKAEIDQLRLQANIERTNMQQTVTQMRMDQRDRDLEYKKQKQEDDLEFKKGALKERVSVMRERIQAENTRSTLQLKQLERQIKNDDQRAGLRKVQALNAQMKSIEQEFSGLENMAVNGNQQQRDAAGARLEALRTQYDQLYTRYSEEVGTFLDSTEAHVKESGTRPTGAGSGKSTPNAQSRSGRKVGDIVTQGGKRYKITGFAADGTPEGEPVQ